MCTHECPDFNIEIESEANDSIEFKAIFNLAKVSYLPFGKLNYEEIHLKNIKDGSFVSDVITATNEEFNNSSNKPIKKSIGHLRKGMTYKPIVKVFAKVNLINTQDRGTEKVSTLIHECEDDEKVSNKYSTYGYYLNFGFFSQGFLRGMEGWELLTFMTKFPVHEHELNVN